MKFIEKLQLVVIILLPLIFGLFLGLSPLDHGMKELWEKNLIAQKNADNLQIVSINKKILTIQPWRENELIAVANASYQLENWQEVIDAYTEFSRNHKLGGEDLYLLAEAYWKNDQKEAARLVWNQIRDQKEITIEEISNLVLIQQTHQDFYQAYQTLLTWRERFPQDNTLFYPLGLSQIIYDPENSEKSLLRALESNQEKIEQVRGFQEGLESIIAEDDPVLRLMLAGNLFSQQNEWVYAASAYALVTRSVPDYAEAWALYGNAIYYLGQDGQLYIQKAVELDSKSKLVNAILAYSTRREGKYQETLRIFEELSKQEPDNAVWVYEIAQTFAVMGEIDSALSYHQQAVTLNDSDPFYWEALARFSLEYSIGLDTVGLEAGRKALSLQPENGLTNDLMGWIFFNLDDLVSAERFLLRAEKYAPYSAIVHLHLGQLYLKTNQPSLADENLRFCIKVAESDQIKQQATYLLENFLSN